jgi:predicted nucleic acid-binding protein
MQRKILLHPDIEVYVPEHVLGELKNYRDAFIEKSGLDETEYDTLFEKIISNIMAGYCPS